MNAALDISETDFVDRRGHKGPERQCLVSGETRLKTEMIRFVVSPDNVVMPDIAGKLPGRGVWVSANKQAVSDAVTKGLFNRGFKSKVSLPENLCGQTEALLARRLLGLITMGVKSGYMLLGFDQVKTAAGSDYLAWRIEASDGAEGGRGKIRVLTKAVSRELEKPVTPVLGCFSSETLGKAVGRDHITHAAIKPGSMAKSISQAAQRLSGFLPLIPPEWPDFAHETAMKKNRKKHPIES